MTGGITLYAYPFRSRAERVLWALKDLEFEFTVVRLNPFEGEQINPEILKLNPDGKVPILVHDGVIFLESLAIMEYLNSISINKHLVPSEVTIHYDYHKKLHYGLTEIEPYLWLAEQSKGPLRKFYHWPEGVYEESISLVARNCKVVKTFLACEQHMITCGFSMADIFFYHILTWAKQHGIQHDPKIENYLDHLEKRESFPNEMYWKSK